MDTLVQPAPRPSLSDEMVASQRRLLHGLEQDFKIARPLFLNSAASWADNFLVSARQLTQRSIGRYRLDFDMNEAGVQELWFDLESSGPELKTTAWVQAQWPDLKVCALRLVGVLCSHLPEQSIYLNASGSGLHVRTFVKGIGSETHRAALLCALLEQAGIENTKSAEGKAGCDYPSTLSVRRKVREVGGPNADKRFAGKANYKHYCTWIPLSELEGLANYPFCEYARDVAYPRCYHAAELPAAWRREALPAPLHAEQTVLPREHMPPQAVCSASQPTRPSRPLSDFWQLLRRDRKLADLFYGKKPIEGLKDQSRSGREMSLVAKLVYYEFAFDQIDNILRNARIGKWMKASATYRRRTYDMALDL